MGQTHFERIVAIGDVHGCHKELQLLLARIKPDARTLLVFLGDYVDRGPESRHVIDTIIELSARIPVVALRGNHEAMFQDFLEHPESVGAGLFILNGGGSTLASYQGPDGTWDVPKSHRRFLAELKPWFETDAYFFVHAGVPNVPLRDLSVAEHGEETLWIRSSFLQSRFQWEKRIIHGHTPTEDVEILPKRINVDTGCVYDGKLSAVELPSLRVISVDRQNKDEAPILLRDRGDSSRAAVRFKGNLRVLVDRPRGAIEFETLNYNQIGLLIQELPRDPISRAIGGPQLAVGESITGRIGRTGVVEVLFMGQVVRMETRGDANFYGVKITRLTVPGDALPGGTKS